MSKQSDPIILDATSERIVKRIALSTFKATKGLTHKAKQLPGAIKTAANDVRQAWHESSIPNV